MKTDLVTELLEQQSGVIARHQIIGRDDHAGEIQRRLRRREWVRLLPGVFLHHTGEPTWVQRAWAGVLACWPAVLDVATNRADELSAIETLAEACRTRRTTPDRLLTALRQRPRIRDRRFLESVLGDVSVGACSVLGARCSNRHISTAWSGHTGCRQGSVSWLRRRPSAGSCGTWSTTSSGSSWSSTGGSTTARLGSATATSIGTPDAAVDGRSTVRLGWGQVFDRPCLTAKRIAVLLTERGWPGRTRSCGGDCPL